MSILCVGQLVADVVVRPVDALPRAGTAELVDDLQLTAGGCAANTACVLAKLGVETFVAGAVGCDIFGDAVLAGMSSCGVDVSCVHREASSATSAVIVIVSSNGERSFLYRNGANESLRVEMIPSELLNRARFVHVGGAMKLVKLDLRRLLSTAKTQGCTTSLDTDWDPRGQWMSALAESLPYVDYLLTNESEGQQLTGLEHPSAIGKSLLERGPRAVVVKCGSRGAWVICQEFTREFPAFEVPVLDTTCAGDAFAAGFLAALSEGWDLIRAAALGNAAGALCTTQVSHRGVVSREETLKLIPNDRVPMCRTRIRHAGTTATGRRSS